jgi:DNA polymerase-3 subunit epsilon
LDGVIKIMDYYTIDFETANSSLTSACSIGIVGVKNGVIKLEEYYLINPEEEFCEQNILIHNIKENDVKDALKFSEVWKKIKHYFTETYVFAHNAHFDISVLKACLEKYNLEKPSFNFGCTVRIAQKLWKEELPNVKLQTISRYLNLNHNHHNALSDAYVCAEIVILAERIHSVATHTELYEALGLSFGVLNKEKFLNTTSKYKNKIKPKVNNKALKEKVIVISGKPKNLTRKSLIEKLLINGAYIDKNINRRTDYFVELDNCVKTLKDKALRMKEESHLEIIDEAKLLRLLEIEC